MNVLVIIPAKTDSKRLPKKNLQIINGKTLVEISIDYAKKIFPFYRSQIVVTSESDEVLQIAKKYKVKPHKRSSELCGDVEVVDVYLDVIENCNYGLRLKKGDLIVCLQPDHPDREHTLKYCIDYMVDNNYDDIITIESDYRRSGSVRIFKYEHFVKGHISKRIGCIRDNATDIHYEEDLKQAQKKLGDPDGFNKGTSIYKQLEIVFPLDKWKKEPSNDWLDNLSEYVNREGASNKGPWYAENGEDGVIEYLFDHINDVNRFGIDIGAGGGKRGSNLRRIVDKNGWRSTELDKREYGGKWQHGRVKIESITKDNICKVLKKYNTRLDVDLLSIDIDSMDYYVLRAIFEGGYRPNVIILEYNPVFNYDEFYVRAYDESYKKNRSSTYGASLAAYCYLLSLYDMELVYAFGTDIEDANNAIFVHKRYIKDKVKSIKEQHPTSWQESFKRGGWDNSTKKDWYRERVFLRVNEDNND